MYEKILVAIDGSEPSEHALQAVKELALLSHGEVLVFHLVERDVYIKVGMVEEETPLEAQKLVSEAVKSLTSAGVKAEGSVKPCLVGHVAKEILEEAEKRNISLIALGSRGRGELTALLLGSTAHKVIHLATTPVLVVR
ncbi:MAG: universal stress protein [Actinobacteria bacterium]|jgi:nucleotide-binding universal stress UspA family protein|nr:universal stress protein [Actinomycetota bacterium]